MATASKITIRPAKMDDAAMLLEWRNDPVTCAMFINSGQTTWENHVAWLERSLAMPTRALYVAELDGEPIGTARFDYEGDDAELSVTIAPRHRGKRLGREMERAAIQHEFSARNPRIIIGRIKEENTAALKIVRSLGFKEVDRVDGLVILHLGGWWDFVF